jgi:hypothetical protein
MEKAILEKVGQKAFSLKGQELKDFVEKTKLMEIFQDIYEFEYNGNFYLVSLNDEYLKYYAIDYIREVLLPEAVFSTNFILDNAEFEENHFKELINDCFKEEIKIIKDELEVGNYDEVINKMNIENLKNLYEEYKNKKISEYKLKKEIESYFDVYFEEFKENFINEIKENPIRYLNDLGYTNEEISKGLQEEGYFECLSLDDYQVAKEVIKYDGIKGTLNIKCISSFNGIEVYERY